MCAKLPGGSVGLLPSGSAPAASGSGVPHQGGAIVTALADPAHANVSASTPRPSRMTLRSLVDKNYTSLAGNRPAAAPTVGQL